MFCGACAGDTFELGEVSRDVEASPSRCESSALVEGSVVLENQEQIEQLEGCEEIAGDLYIRPFAGADFSSLAALKKVGGALELGRLTVFDLEDAPLEVQDGIDAINEQEQALLDSGCFTSLVGFEGLERAGSLSLNGVGAADLQGFSNLSALTNGGVLQIGPCSNLRDLGGLERLSGVVELTQQCNSLESLAGPSFAPSMSNAYIVGASLADLGSFAPESVNELRIEDTALENLDALSQLSRANHIDIFGNRALSNADALEALSFVGDLRIANSPLLERLPELAAIYELDTLSITGNDALTNVPSLPNIGLVSGPAEWGNLAPEEAVRVRPDILQITGNSALQSLAIPAGWLAVGYLDISSNGQLTRIDLGNLHAADALAIGGNPALTSVELGSLETVDDLRIVNNPLLPLEPFDAVQAFRRLVQPGPLELEQL
jgi:hypothetical protein